MTTFNEFERELQRRNIPPELAYLFRLQFERMVHMAKEIEEMAKVVLALTRSLEGFVELHEQQEQKLQRISRGLAADGVDVHSVGIDPEEGKH